MKQIFVLFLSIQYLWAQSKVKKQSDKDAVGLQYCYQFFDALQTRCIQCKIGYKQHLGSCFLDCPEPNGEKCNSCYQGYQLTKMGLCVNYIPNCAVYNVKDNTCQTCNTISYSLENYKKLQEKSKDVYWDKSLFVITRDYILSKDSTKCYPAIPGCKSQTDTECIACDFGFSLSADKKTCCEDCKPGFTFRELIKEGKTIRGCDSNCAEVVNGECTKCKETYLMVQQSGHKDQLKPYCVQSSVVPFCQKYKSDGKCQECLRNTEIPGLTQDTPYQCQEYYYNAVQHVDEHKNSIYQYIVSKDGSQCNLQVPFCLEQNGEFNCTKCCEGYEIDPRAPPGVNVCCPIRDNKN